MEEHRFEELTEALVGRTGDRPAALRAATGGVLAALAARFGGVRPEQQPMGMKRQGLAALLALAMFLGTVAPGLSAGSVGGSGAGNDYRQPRTSASER